MKGRTLWLLMAILAALATWATADWYRALPPTATASYVGSRSCVDCHQAETRAWTGSDHDRAMEIADEASVLGDFDDASFTYFGVTSRFFRRDGKYFVNTEGPDGELHDYHIKYTFGIRPLQQYMVEFPDGRVQVLRVSWDTEQNEWFYVTPPDVTDERILPGDPLHWTGIAQNWNTMCAECHSTDVHKNYDLATGKYNTTFAEIDVACETCHGPGSMHVEIAESHTLFWDRHHGYGLPKLKGVKNSEQLQACAPCHSRRSPICPDFRAGEKFLDYYDPALLREGLYHADGQIQDEVYVYGSFLQSKMYAKDVRCTDCHEPHSLKLKFQGNQLCLQCHVPGKYDTPTHHHHSDEAATQCVNCHMPETKYMVIDGRRDHSFRIPRPDLTVEVGTPNACNTCHTKAEESAAWAAEAVRKWYGEKRPDDPHWAPAFASARNGEPEGEEKLTRLLQRRDLPDIVRATGLELLASYDGAKATAEKRDALDDSDPLVRNSAVRVLTFSTVERLPELVAGLLEDPVRLVRISAARQLAGEAKQLLPASYRTALDEAIKEYQSSQRVMNERATAHLNLAALSQAQGNVRKTMQELRTAMRLEPYLSGVRDKLALLMEQSGGDSTEVRKLREKEVELLQRDAQLFPESDALRYQRGMLLYLLGEYDQARESLVEASRLAPDSYDTWLALALLCEKQQRWQQTVDALKEMNRLRSEDPVAREIFLRIEEARNTQVGSPENEVEAQ